MTDNFFYNCPAKTYNRDLTDYRPNSVMNEQIMKQNNINDYDSYREFLTTKGTEGLPKYGTKCWNNTNIHNYPTRQDPTTFYPEVITSNKNIQDIYNKNKKEINN